MSDALPELPKPGLRDLSGQYYVGYTAEQMREYYRQAVLAERARCAQICERLQDGYGDWKHGTPLDCAAVIRGEPER